MSDENSPAPAAPRTQIHQLPYHGRFSMSFQLLITVAVLGAAVWCAWTTRAILDLRVGKPMIVKVQLQGLIGEYVRAQARTDTPQEQIASETKAFLDQLQKSVQMLSTDGRVVLVNEAVVGGNVVDLTNQVRRAVYAKVPMPKVAAAGSVENKMLAYLKQNGEFDGAAR